MKYFLYKISHPLIKCYWNVFKPKTHGARAIILHRNNILLVKNINVIYWSLPGGKIDQEENPEQCILRELREELHLNEIEIKFKLGTYTSNQEGKLDTVYIFVIKLSAPDFKMQWELDDAHWFNINDLPKNISPAGMRRIKEFQAGKKDLFENGRYGIVMFR